MIAAAACGGGDKHSDTYAKGTKVQEACCEHLQEPGRAQCLKDIIRTDDPGVASTKANQASYACVAKHFRCDEHTGRATMESAQLQLECIQDLEQ